VFSNGCIVTKNIAAPASASLFASAWLNSTEGESGSNPNAEEEQHSSSRSLSASRRPLILLLAEDNLPDALLVREAIKAESLPLEVYVVADGARAIEFMAKAESDTQAPSPDILLLDLNLPKIDGLEVLRRIRAGERYKNIPVLVLTSSEAPSDRAETSKLGAGYFRKPPDLDQFLKLGLVLKQFLERNGLL